MVKKREKEKDEKYGDVTNPVALLCVELDSETAWIAERFRRVALVNDSGEAHNQGTDQNKSQEQGS